MPQLFKKPSSQPADGKLSDQDYQDMVQLAALHMRTQMPREALAVKSIKPVNRLEDFIYPPGTQMITGADRTIKYNPHYLPSAQQDLDDTLAHELVHIRQIINAGGYWKALYQFLSQPKDYTARPLEAEAFAEEDARRAYRKDIPLPPAPKKVRKK